MALGYKQYVKKLWKVRLALVLVTLACFFVGWSVITRFMVERDMAARRASVEAEYQALEQRHQVLAENVTYLKDERSLESEIRKHFDVARAGESVVIILDTDEAVATSVATSTNVPVVTPWWQFWQ